ncbi:DUF1667 domain-containing protein [Spirochaeta dissipatitropha]
MSIPAQKTQGESREMICIACPIGCRLKVSIEGEDIQVSGNKCRRGEIYAREECLAPKRMVTTTCRVHYQKNGKESSQGFLQRVPVRSSEAVPVEHIPALLEKLHSMDVASPLPKGSIIIEDIAGTGIQIISSHSV